MATKAKRNNHDFGLVAKNMTYKDLKKAVVVRGMPFEEVINGTFPSLQNWLFKNRSNKVDKSLLNEFDDYIENQLDKMGSHYLIHPSLRLGYIGHKEEEPKEKKVKKKTKKVIRKKNKFGIFEGTKKALTYKLQNKGRSLERTIKKVKRKFPDASEKSIKIWYKKAKRESEK